MIFCSTHLLEHNCHQRGSMGGDADTHSQILEKDLRILWKKGRKDCRTQRYQWHQENKAGIIQLITPHMSSNQPLFKKMIHRIAHSLILWFHFWSPSLRWLKLVSIGHKTSQHTKQTPLHDTLVLISLWPLFFFFMTHLC